MLEAAILNPYLTEHQPIYLIDTNCDLSIFNMLSDILNNATIMAPNVTGLLGIPVVIIVLEQPREATAWTLVLDLHNHAS